MALPKIQKLYNKLATGKNVPVTTLQKVSGLANISAAVNTLRQNGNRIYFNKAAKVGNKKADSYRMAV